MPNLYTFIDAFLNVQSNTMSLHSEPSYITLKT